MPRSTFPPHIPHVALLVETSLGSGRDILRGIARYVRERGPWSLFHAPRSLDESAPAWLRHWKGDGIIARIADAQLASMVKDSGLPVVDVLGNVPRSRFPLVHVDDAAIARLAFAHFRERGFRRFAYFGLSGESWSARRRDVYFVEARLAGAQPALLELTRAEIERTPWERRQEKLAGWLRELAKPVGLMVCSDQRGLDVSEACRRANIAVPDQIAIVGVDNDEPLCQVCDPPLSSVWPDHIAVGYEAAALLRDLMNGVEPPAEPKLVAPRRLVTRHSSDVLAVEDAVVSAALRVIRERACTGISVDEIARVSGASRSVLQRRFRALLGLSIHDQIIETRLKRAAELIATTDVPLAEVAELSGFKHQEYLGVVFKERVGVTPAEHRRASR